MTWNRADYLKNYRRLVEEGKADLSSADPQIDPELANEGLRRIVRDQLKIIDNQRTVIEAQRQGLDHKDREIEYLNNDRLKKAARLDELETLLKRVLRGIMRGSLSKSLVHNIQRIVGESLND